MLQQPRTSALHTLSTVIHRELWDGVVRVGSLCLNHPEGVPKHPTHVALSVVACFL